MSALAGLRVIEFCDEQGEWAGKLLADMGADVVKVELPGGAPTRRIGPYVDDVPGPERSLHFWHYNTSKRSVTLDPATRAGRALLLQLCAGADAFLTTEDVDGLGWDALSLANPRLVMCAITPWGSDGGPYASYQSGDLIQMAMGGIISSCGYDDHDLPPMRPGAWHSAHLAGWHAVIGVLVALLARDETERGQFVDIAVHDCVGVCTEFAATHWFYKQELVMRQTARHAMIVRTPRSMFPARDGGFVNLTTVDDRAFEYFASFASEAGVDMDAFRDEEGTFTRGPGLGEAIRAITAILEADEVWLAGQALGMTWASVRKPEDWLDDPHADERGFFHEASYDGVTVKHPGPPFLFTEHPGIVRRAPRLGEHNDEVYGELGYTAGELTALRDAGVV